MFSLAAAMFGAALAALSASFSMFWTGREIDGKNLEQPETQRDAQHCPSRHQDYCDNVSHEGHYVHVSSLIMTRHN
jgi:hypothetical protein